MAAENLQFLTVLLLILPNKTVKITEYDAEPFKKKKRWFEFSEMCV